MKVQKVLDLCTLMENKVHQKFRDFFSPFMRFSHYAVFPRKQKTHKRRTKCSIVNVCISVRPFTYYALTSFTVFGSRLRLFVVFPSE